MARADAKSPILRACWAILRLLAVAGKQSGEPRPVCRVVGAAVLADGEYADAYVKEQHCRRSVRRGLPCRPSRHRPASLRCRGSAIASVTGIMMRCCVRRRSSDPPGIRPDGASSHRMGECQRAVAVAADTCRCEGTLFAVDPETHVANHNRCDIVGRLRDERPNTLRSVRRGDEVRMATWHWI